MGSGIVCPRCHDARRHRAARADRWRDPNLQVLEEEWYLAPVLMLILLTPLGGPGGEEYFGWRGYAQPALLKRWGQWAPLIASVMIGIAWGVWHLPEFYNPVSTQHALGIGFFVPFIVSEVATSVVITWLYLRDRRQCPHRRHCLPPDVGYILHGTDRFHPE